MGKYAPVIKTAECGSMTGQPKPWVTPSQSLGYIINNIENELGSRFLSGPARVLDRGRCRPAGNYAPD